MASTACSFAKEALPLRHSLAELGRGASVHIASSVEVVINFGNRTDGPANKEQFECSVGSVVATG